MSMCIFFFDKRFKRLIYLSYWRTKQCKCFVLEEETKAKVNLFERKSAKLRKIRKYFIQPKIENEDFG